MTATVTSSDAKVVTVSTPSLQLVGGKPLPPDQVQPAGAGTAFVSLSIQGQVAPASGNQMVADLELLQQLIQHQSMEK